MPATEQVKQFLENGWCRFDHDPQLEQWVEAIRPVAHACVAAPENAQWLRCGGTWFIGVNALPNNAEGAVDGGLPLAGRAVDFIRNDLAMREFAWDRGQVSVVYPGYPKRVPSESASAYRYRVDRDAAHVDGILREGPDGRRFVRNLHDFLLGIPLVDVSADTSPFVVWEKSHELVRAALQARIGGIRPRAWAQEDVTDLYNDVRNRIFDECDRVEVTAGPGEAYLVHRFALHGIAPWSPSGPQDIDGRMVVYFRPESLAPEDWLNAR